MLVNGGVEANGWSRYVNLTTQERSYKASFFEFVHAFQVYGTDPVVPRYVPA